MDNAGERIPLAPAKGKKLGKLLVGQGAFEGSGMIQFGTRVLSPKTNVTNNYNGLSGGSYKALNTGVNNMHVAGLSYKGIKVSQRLQLATPSPDISPQIFDKLAQPEDDTVHTQKLAIGTSRSTSVEVSDQLYKSGNFFTPNTLANQTQPFSPERENVSLYVKKMQSDQNLTFQETNFEDRCFQFQDPEDMHDTDLPGMIHEIDNELERVVPGEDHEICQTGFQAVNEKAKSLIMEETVPSLGVKVRSNGPKPVDQDLNNLNIMFTRHDQEACDYKNTLNELLKKLLVKNNTTVTPSSAFKEGHVLYGTEKACKEMLERSEFLPSQGTHGVILFDKLRPKAGLFTEDHYAVMEVLGKGNFGEVKLCRDKTTNAKFVRKQLGSSDYKKSEVEVMMALKHQNITRFYGVIQREGTTEILMEYSGVSLLFFTLLPDTQHLVTEEFIWNVNRQGLSALAHLAIYGIIHLDVKPENTCILETATGWTVKLTDFGSAKLPQDLLSYNGWTAEYMSPESCINFVTSRFPQVTLDNSKDWTVTPKSDVYGWALTVVFMYRKTHILMHVHTEGQNNYKNVENPNQVKLLIIMSMARDPDMVKRCLIPDDCSPDMKLLMNGMLVGNPTQRLSAAEAVATIDKISTDKLLSMGNPFPDLFDKDCFIYDPSEVQTPAPGPTRVRRTSCVSSQGSISSMLSYTSNGSKQGGPPKGSAQNGKGRRRSVKRKLRDRISSPYPRNDTFESLSPSTQLDGNVPDFAALV